MPYFHFHLVGADGAYSRDEDGVFFDSVEEAYLDAHRSVLEIGFEMLRQRQYPLGHRFEVTDQSGRLLLNISFAEVLRPDHVSRETLTSDFFASIRLEMQRSRTLKAELSRQISIARATIEATRTLLAEPKVAVVPA